MSCFPQEYKYRWMCKDFFSVMYQLLHFGYYFGEMLLLVLPQFHVWCCRKSQKVRRENSKDTAEAQEGSHFPHYCRDLQLSNHLCCCFENFQPSNSYEEAQVENLFHHEKALFNSSVTPAFRSSPSTRRRRLRCSWTVFKKTMMLSKCTNTHCQPIGDNKTSIDF